MIRHEYIFAKVKNKLKRCLGMIACTMLHSGDNTLSFHAV